jgi:hypothetical protein
VLCQPLELGYQPRHPSSHVHDTLLFSVPSHLCAVPTGLISEIRDVAGDEDFMGCGMARTICSASRARGILIFSLEVGPNGIVLILA